MLGIDKIKLYYKPSEEINAYALGHRTVIVTHGLINSMDADMIKGVLAHEFGHIASGDSDLKLGISVSNSILMIFALIINFIITFFSIVIGLATKKVSGLVFGKILGSIGVFLVTLVYGIWTKIGMLLVNAGANLYTALDALDGVKAKSNFFSLLASTHPDTVDRLAAIRTRLEGKA